MTRIAGIWDWARSGGSLGSLLILLEELQIQCRTHGADAIDVFIVRDAVDLIDGMPPGGPDAPGRLPVPDPGKAAAMAGIARAMSGVADCRVCFEQAAVRDAKALMRTGRIMWPDPELLVRGGHCYDTTRAIQDFYSRAREIPRLSVGAGLAGWADAYLKERAEGRMPVAVHLKNNREIAGRSNARMDSWLTFMSGCQREHRVHFFLVGDDPVDPRFRALRNATIAQDDGLTLDRSLALIQVAGLFMGMMSGPANMALFGKNPYLIFKNHDHHAREMASELGDSDHYPFALPHQRVLRTWDTTENLVAAFDDVITRAFA